MEDWMKMLVPVIAILGVWIAYWQMSINRARLRHELFDRRMEVYTRVQMAIQAVMAEAKVEQEILRDIRYAEQRAEFLFDNDVTAHLDHTFKELAKLRMTQRKMQGPVDESEHARLVDEENILLTSVPSLVDRFHALVKPYLQFKKNW